MLGPYIIIFLEDFIMFKDIKSIIPKSVKRSGISKDLKSEVISRVFKAETVKLLSPDLASKIRPLYIRGGIIKIASLSTTAIKELEQLEEKIINNINKSLGKEAVKGIRCIGLKKYE